MQYLVNAQEMKDCDARTMEYYQIPSMVLMERAALACTEEIMAGNYDLSKVGIICGMGNNGGDGLAIARLLYQKNVPVRIFLIGKEEKATKQTKAQLAIIRKYTASSLTTWNPPQSMQELQNCTLLLDAIFGVGLSRKIVGDYAELIQAINKCSAPKISIDIPSGIDAGNGQILGYAVKAEQTITFAFLKAGLVLYPGANYAGKVTVKEIGITEESFAGHLPYLYTYSTQEVLELLPKRPKRSNKGTFGKVVLVAGCKGMAGAAYFAALAAYRMGCGLVRIITPEENREILQTLIPEAVLTTYDAEQIVKEHNYILEAMQWGTVIGIGPGLGTDYAASYLLDMVLNKTSVPLLIDGDGLNLLAKKIKAVKEVRAAKEPRSLCSQQADKKIRPTVITPHLGEMSRLTGLSIKEIQQNFIPIAVDFAKEQQVCCVLKDARTVVADFMSYHKNPFMASEQVYLNLTGNSGMATGGSGDILAGMICGLAAQNIDLGQAAVMGVHLHGCAGDAAASAVGESRMTARDILDYIDI